MKITKKNILFFILGFLAYFVIDTLTNWDQNVKDFKRGFNAGYEDVRK